MNQALRSSFDTRSVAKADRLDFWEERASADIVGLECSSLEEEGFQARFDHYDLSSFSLVDIVGRQHVVSRSPELVRKREKDSVFLMLLLSGSAFVNRNGQCTLMNQGDLVLYDQNEPYMHGFVTNLHHLIIDLPGHKFRRRFPGWDLKDALRIDGNAGSGAMIANFVRRLYGEVCSRKHMAPNPNQVDDVWAALEITHDMCLRGRPLSTYQLGIVQRVKKFVRLHLGETGLNTETVAQEIGMSSRQLNRILGLANLSVKKLILEERLTQARISLEAGGHAAESVGELSYRYGFSAPSQFTRAFRKRYGVGPAEIRRRLS